MSRTINLFIFFPPDEIQFSHPDLFDNDIIELLK